MDNKVYDYLGLATRSRNLVSGTNTVISKIKKIKLIIISDDIVPRSKDEVEHLAKQHQIEILQFGTSEQLGKVIGKSYTKVIGITDPGFANKIKEIYREEK